MVVGFGVDLSEKRRVESDGLARGFALGEAADHVIGDENRRVSEGSVNGEGIMECWGGLR